MGLIREPKGVDLVVGPSSLTPADKKMISAIIADYKKTGRVPVKSVAKRGKKHTTIKA
ncbi:hypothetical protein [Ferruginibacter sp.]